MRMRHLPKGYEKNIEKAHCEKGMILPNGDIRTMDGYVSKQNNNVLVIGRSGGGKTTAVFAPNLLARYGSYLISDPKGKLYKEYAEVMRREGYHVRYINFSRPRESTDGYSPLRYVKGPDEILALSHQIMNVDKEKSGYDPFWDMAGKILLSSIIGYIIESGTEELTFSMISRLLSYIDPETLEEGGRCRFVEMLDELTREAKMAGERTPWCVEQFRKFLGLARKTMSCIMMTVQANLRGVDTPEIEEMMQKPAINFKEIGQRPTVVFVGVSDTDRSKDGLINIFYGQVMHHLCDYADNECEDGRIPIPVRFMLDDFGTNCVIDGFENVISNIRARNISVVLALQSEAQLECGYGRASQTIIDNCDTYIFLGSNNPESAIPVAKRMGCSLEEVLNMPCMTNVVMRTGQRPFHSRTIELFEYDYVKGLKDENDRGASQEGQKSDKKQKMEFELEWD